MDNKNQPKSRNWIKEVFAICKIIFCHFISRWGGVKCEEHRMSTILVATLLMSTIVGGGLAGGWHLILETGKYIYNNTVVANTQGNKTQVASPIVSTIGSELFAQSPKLNISDDAKNCDLQSAKWDLWFGNKLNTDVEDNTLLSLPVSSAQALYKYLGDVPNVAVCEFVFIPRGEKAINYVISYDGIFQVVIGDNDYWTISLRASDRLDGPLYSVEETQTGKTRPRLLSSAKQAAPIRVRLERIVTEDGKFDITLTITYQPEIVGEIDTPPETFNWKFTPSPAAIIKPIELSIGLIRAKNDKSEIGVSFIYPNPITSKVSE